MREIDTIVKDAMIAFGFVLKGSSWYKFTDDFVQVLNFQKSYFSNLYYLNVGIDTRSHSKLQYLPECRFGVRLRADMLIPERDLLIALDFQSEMDPAERTETICSIVGKCHSFLDSVSSWAQLRLLMFSNLFRNSGNSTVPSCLLGMRQANGRLAKQRSISDVLCL